MTELIPPRLEGAIHVDDHREFGYAEYGPITGRPILWFHATPGGRRQIPPAARAAAVAQNFRIIAIERPGVGESTPHLYDSVSDWARDIEGLVDRLGIEHFAVVGLSGGGPYALACAHRMPNRVVTAAILGGVAPSVGEEAPPGGLIALLPWCTTAVAWAQMPLGGFMRNLLKMLAPAADPVTDLFLKLLPPGDRRVFDDPVVRFMFHDDLLCSGTRGMQAMFGDLILFGRPWGFNLREIRVPVHFWHGDADNVIPLSHGEHMAKLVQHSSLRLRHGEGHLGGLGATEEILDSILEHWPSDGVFEETPTEAAG
jgi:pimeloyl-ACP methyl ester carboxylesterase